MFSLKSKMVCRLSDCAMLGFAVLVIFRPNLSDAVPCGLMSITLLPKMVSNSSLSTLNLVSEPPWRSKLSLR